MIHEKRESRKEENEKCQKKLKNTWQREGEENIKDRIKIRDFL